MKLKAFFALITLGSVLMVGCSKNDGSDDGGSSGGGGGKILPEYSIMVYGCAGGNLDESLDGNIAEAIKANVKNVPMTWLVKYSAKHQTNPEKSGLRRFVINENGIENLEIVGDASFPLYKPENLAEFIKWSKQKYPAKKYILILWNHGGGWLPNTDSPKKAVIFDDNLGGIPMTLDEVVKGVTLSGTKLDVIYYDACLMGGLENLSGLTSVADYALMSNHVTYGGEYTLLRRALSSDVNIETAFVKYGTNVIAYYKGNVTTADLVFTRLNKVSAANEIIKEISQELVSTYGQYTADYNRALTDTYYYDKDYPLYDINNYVSLLAKYSDNPKMNEYSQSLKTAIDQAIVFRDDIGKLGKTISWSVTAINKSQWESNDYNNGIYEALAFDKATGWSNWLKINESVTPDFPVNPDDDHE